MMGEFTVFGAVSPRDLGKWRLGRMPTWPRVCLTSRRPVTLDYGILSLDRVDVSHGTSRGVIVITTDVP